MNHSALFALGGSERREELSVTYKKFRVCILAVVLATILSAQALAQATFDGSVVSKETVAISAPFGGLVDKITLRKGDVLHVGDPVATIATTKVYAPADGVVSGVFAREGDDTEGITTRDGAVMYLEPTNKYIVSATTEKAYNSSATKYVHIGEKVYLSCTKDGSHVGTAVVTTISEADESGNTPYKLEVTGGEFYMGETVGIYRDSSYKSSSRIGRGTIQQNTAIAVKRTGSVLKLHVQAGDRVERGELLFETVEGALDGLYAMDNTLVSALDGIVATVDVAPGASVEKGAKLITVYPDDAMQIEIKVSELDMKDIAEGDRVAIEFEWDVDGVLRLEGVVSGISHVNAEQAEGSASSDSEYSAYVDFEPVEGVRLGMSVIVYVLEDSGETAGLETEPLKEE